MLKTATVASCYRLLLMVETSLNGGTSMVDVYYKSISRSEKKKIFGLNKKKKKIAKIIEFAMR